MVKVRSDDFLALGLILISIFIIMIANNLTGINQLIGTIGAVIVIIAEIVFLVQRKIIW